MFSFESEVKDGMLTKIKEVAEESSKSSTIKEENSSKVRLSTTFGPIYAETSLKTEVEQIPPISNNNTTKDLKTHSIKFATEDLDN